MNRQFTLNLLGIAALLLISRSTSPAQSPAQAPPATQANAAVATPARTSSDTNQKYKIGQGDVLIIRVFGHEELSRETPVTSSGTIRMPFFGEVQASCLTEAELSVEIAEKLRKYLKDPQVDVVVKEYRSQPVSVIGAVAQPGRFQLQRRIRLLELLTYAGGPSINAGSTVFVIHNNELSSCEKPVAEETLAASTATEADAVLSSFKLKELLTGAPSANLYVKPGDIISIPEADQVFVTGGVVRPGAVPLRGAMTVFSAISMAGGFSQEASKKNVQIIRQDPNTGTRHETVINVEDIERRKAEDVLLFANDVVNVQGSVVKSLRKSLMQIIPATVSAMPLIILP